MTKKILAAKKYHLTVDMVNDDALYVIEKLNKNGFEAFIVGGGIRDLLLGKTPKDFDIVTNAAPEIVNKIFKRHSMIIGRRFKIVHVIFNNINPDKIYRNRPAIDRHVIEVSTYRSNKVHKKNLSVHGKIISDNNYGTQKEDSIRRDFTINALYYDPLKQEIIDYHNGIKDIQNKVLRIIGNPMERYIEDPVRMIRAIRLSAKLNFTIDKKTAMYFDKVKLLLVNEHKGRMYEEMLKILLSGSSTKCVEIFKQLELPEDIFPLFDRLFLGSHPSELAQIILTKTDNRLHDGNDISVIFLLAGLFWDIVTKIWNKTVSYGGSPRQSLMDAIDEIQHFAYGIGVTRNMFSAMREIWLLQIDFETPNIRKMEQVLNNNRFRQAWHLFSARHELKEVDSKIYSWWDKFIGSEPEQQITLIGELKQLTSIKKDTANKTIKRKKNIKNKVNQ